MTGGASLAVRALAVWAAILVLAVANGGLREAVLIPRLGTVAGQAFSGVLLSVYQPVMPRRFQHIVIDALASEIVVPSASRSVSWLPSSW